MYKKAVELPTRYFEAKSQRKVSLQEVAYAVIPDNTNEHICSQLDKHEIKYIEYEAGNDNARIAALNSLNEYKFSVSKSVSTDSPDDRVSYSITEPFVDNNGTNFGNAVLLDTTFFDGLSPRNWGDKLKSFVFNRSEKNPFILPIIDENGNNSHPK